MSVTGEKLESNSLLSFGAEIAKIAGKEALGNRPAAPEEVMELYGRMSGEAYVFAAAMLDAGAGFDVLRQESPRTETITKSFGRQQTRRMIDGVEVGGWIIREGRDYSGCSLRSAYRRDGNLGLEHLDVTENPWPLDARGRPLVSRYWYKAIAVLTSGQVVKVTQHGDLAANGPIDGPKYAIRKFDVDTIPSPQDVFAWNLTEQQLASIPAQWQDDMKAAAERYASKPQPTILHTYCYPAPEE